jgi:hypothetical protein
MQDLDKVVDNMQQCNPYKFRSYKVKRINAELDSKA